MRSPFGEVLAALERGLGALGVRWYLFGAQAALLYGSARLTADVDVTVDLGDVDPARLVAALAVAGFKMRVEGGDFAQRTRVLPVLHIPTGVAADIVLAGPGLEELFLDRAMIRDVDGARVPVARPEDIVAMKILASRPKDLDDVVSILAARADLDLNLLRATLKLLEDALDQSDLLPALEAALVRARGAKPATRRPPGRPATPKKKRRPRSP